VFVGSLILYHLMYRSFFPNRMGGLGHDYSYVLPMLLAGRYWYATNGLVSVPWFTPAFCGGIPLLADPQSFYYSIPQGLAFVLGPLSAAYTSVLLFAAVGYWGFFMLCRRSFGSSRESAVVGGALFMFNGFFAYRMVIGHFLFHGIMLIPWIALAVLGSRDHGARRLGLADVQKGVAAGLCGAYWIYSGMVSIVIPATLAVALIVCVHGTFMRETIALRAFAVRAGVAAMVTTGLSAFKLVGVFAYLGAFPRADYLLPGLKSGWQTVAFAFKFLFLARPNIHLEIADQLVNVQWRLGRHEFEYGVGVAALVLLVWGAWTIASGALAERRGGVPVPAGRRALLLSLAMLILAVPLALNTYTPEWNAFLKKVPLLRSSTNLFRWFVIYIPFLILLSVLALERTPDRLRTRVAVLALGLLAFENLTADRGSYATESYRPEPMLAAYEKLASGVPVAPIDAIRQRLGGGGVAGASRFPNDQFVDGRSAFPCYNPIFGFRLENFPIRTLHEGSIDDEDAGRLNLKNPACYVYPAENACRPGDHFSVSERRDMQRFAGYHPYEFKASRLQHIANWTSAGTFLFALLILGVGVLKTSTVQSRSSQIGAHGG
jgi:hypothetical protein